MARLDANYLNYISLNYISLGNPQKPVLLILHGFLGSLDNWKFFSKQLQDDFHIFIVDLPNHGHSPHSEDFSYEAMAQNIKYFIDKNKIEKLLLMGHSMGGKVAIEITKLYPHLISQLIVIDISPKKYEKIESKKIIFILNKIDLTQFQNRFQVEKVLEKFFNNKTIIKFLVKSISLEGEILKWNFNLKLFNEKIEALAEGIDLAEPILTPTLFVKGEKSNFIQKEDESLIHHKFKNVELITIAQAGHWVHYEQGEKFLDELKKFFKKEKLL